MLDPITNNDGKLVAIFFIAYTVYFCRSSEEHNSTVKVIAINATQITNSVWDNIFNVETDE